MRTVRVLTATVLCCTLAAPSRSWSAGSAKGPQADEQGYALVWSDEFDGTGRPDPAKWNFENGFVRNGEMQWYQPDNATLRNGVLVIEGRREHRPNPDFANPQQRPDFRARRFINFTSASLTTRDRQSWQYGRFEIRARFKAETGLWPALWFVGAKGKWPASGEIDLLEYYDHAILGNFAWASAKRGRPVWKGAKVPLARISDDPDWDKRFHTWTMDWTEHQIRLLLDNREINRIDLDTVRNADGSAIANPFRQPHYLIINLALGGQRGGSLAQTTLPAQFEIDYVRVFQKVAK